MSDDTNARRELAYVRACQARDFALMNQREAFIEGWAAGLAYSTRETAGGMTLPSVEDAGRAIAAEIDAEVEAREASPPVEDEPPTPSEDWKSCRVCKPRRACPVHAEEAARYYAPRDPGVPADAAKVEQELENKQVRQMQRTGRCPICGADA